MSDAEPGAGGTLFVVATPIGNLADVTLRALDTLREVALIAAEDTRVTRRLLDRHGVRTRTISYHARSGPRRMDALLAHLRDGSDLALTTDAGTPGVSDPGEDLVRAWAAEGGHVVAIPGPSAVLAAVVASGIAGPRWSFEGFLPRRGRFRRERLARIAADDRASVIFEAPARVAATLRDLARACGAERAAAVCRELTKAHEQVVRGSLGELEADLESGRLPARGEFVLVVASRPDGDIARQGEIPGGLASAVEAVAAEVASGVPRGDAVRSVAGDRGIRRRQLYGAARLAAETEAKPLKRP